MAAQQTSGVNVVNNTFASASVVDLVYLTAPAYSVKVTNVTGTAAIYFTVGSPGGACPVPTIGGTGDFCLPATAGTSLSTRAGDFQFGTIVQLISTGTPQYMVELQSIRATS